MLLFCRWRWWSRRVLIQDPIFRHALRRILDPIALRALDQAQDDSACVISVTVRRWPFWQAGENRRPVAEGAEGSCPSASTTVFGEQVPPGCAVTWWALYLMFCLLFCAFLLLKQSVGVKGWEGMFCFALKYFSEPPSDMYWVPWIVQLLACEKLWTVCLRACFACSRKE